MSLHYCPCSLSSFLKTPSLTLVCCDARTFRIFVLRLTSIIPYAILILTPFIPLSLSVFLCPFSPLFSYCLMFFSLIAWCCFPLLLDVVFSYCLMLFSLITWCCFLLLLDIVFPYYLMLFSLIAWCCFLLLLDVVFSYCLMFFSLTAWCSFLQLLDVVFSYSFSSGIMDTFWKSGATCFTAVIFVVNFKVAIAVDITLAMILIIRDSCF